MLSKGILRQYYAAFSCLLCTMIHGVAFTWYNPLMVSLNDGEIVAITPEQSSWMVASIEIGELISPIPVGMLVNRWGRKFWIATTCPTVIISYIILWFTCSIEGMFIVRILQGLSLGVCFTVCPIYLAEIAEPKIRGMICGHFQTMWILGLLFTNCTGPFLSYDNYILVSASLSFIFIITFIWVPDTPYFYLFNGNEKSAEKSLAWFRGTEEIKDEFQNIKDGLYTESEGKESSWLGLFATAEDRRILLVVSSVCFVKYMSGSPAIFSYVTQTLTESPSLKTTDPNLIAIGITLINLIGVVASASISDHIGRKPLIYFSTIGTIIFNLITALYFYLEYIQVPGIEPYSWISYTSLTLYCLINNVGLGPLLQTLQAECFPLRNRGLGGGFISIIGTVTCFIVLKQYQTVITYFGVYMNYVIFTLCSVLGSIFLLIFMKETAGMSLSEIQYSSKTSNKLTGIENPDPVSIVDN